MRIKNSNETPELDMNPMVDMAFLLVSFFMLTTTFKTVEPVTVDKPSSTSNIKVPERNIMKITVDEQGAVYFGIDNKFTRQALIKKMALINDLEFSEDEISAFGLISGMGVSLAELSNFLSLPTEEQKLYKQTGIPCMDERNELREWILTTRLINPNHRISILADRDTPYEYIRCVINTLQDLRIYRFNLVTDLE